DEIGVETDDGIASAHRAALHRFQQEAHGARAGDLEKRRHRGFEIRDQRGPDDLRLAAGVSLGKRRCLRLDLHGERQFALSRAPPALSLSTISVALALSRVAISWSRQRVSTCSFTSSSGRSREGVIPTTSNQM